MDTTEIKYVNTLLDLVRFNLYHLPRTGAMQLLLLALVAMHAWTFVPALAKMSEPAGTKVLVFLFTLSVMILCVALIQLIVILFSYRPSKNRGLLTEHTLRITGAGLVEETSFNASTFAWAGISKVSQNGAYIFVYVQQNMAHIVPKRAFRSLSEAEDFFQVVRSHVLTPSGAL